jgi:hypothetical protein
MMWASKAKYFTAAACMLLVVSLMCFGRTVFDKITYKNNERIRQQVKNVIVAANQADSKLKEERDKGSVSGAVIQKAFEPLKNRDVVPLLQQTMISVLPNAKNNPGQSELYAAFDSGEVKAVMEIPRSQRKQIFVTGMSITFTDDIASAPFGTTEFQKGAGKKASKAGEEDFGVDSVSTTKIVSVPSARAETPTAAAEGEAAAGFVVTVTGYSPYKNLGELMDPVGVEKDPNKWGVIMRLLHLKDNIDGNSPFELYKKTEISHFNLVTGEVGMDAEMPYGTGILSVMKSGPLAGETILIDPMTKEVISKLPEYDEYVRKKVDRLGKVQYKVNDRWFKLDCKFVWKKAAAAASSGS